MKRSMIAVMFFALLAVPLVGCEREGPAEQAGEEVDRGVDRAGEAVEGATEREER